MRINRFVALSTGLSRRKADDLITEGRVSLDGNTAGPGDQVTANSLVKLDGQRLQLKPSLTIMLNKPTGYVSSRNGQGSLTIYDLLPEDYSALKSIGRLDKESSGLLLLTNDGELANRLTHPSYAKNKLYEVSLDKDLSKDDEAKINNGVELDDGLSRMQLSSRGSKQDWLVTIHEGRNRQIRRTFEALGYRVKRLHRTAFGDYTLNDLASGEFVVVETN